MRRLQLFVSLALLAGCGSDLELKAPDPGGPDTMTAVTNLPCDVEAVFRTRCQTCHSASPTSGATIPLVTHADLHEEQGGQKVHELVGERIHDAFRTMPPPPAKLTAEEIATLDGWIQSGAPMSSEACR